jgi:hypothetical protein
MVELFRSNDPVLLSFAGALMRDSGIGYFVADENMSIVEGSLGILPRRFMVEEEELETARRLIADAGIDHDVDRR